jgi:hypothetical protein
MTRTWELGIRAQVPLQGRVYSSKSSEGDECSDLVFFPPQSFACAVSLLRHFVEQYLGCMQLGHLTRAATAAFLLCWLGDGMKRGRGWGGGGRSTGCRVETASSPTLKAVYSTAR